MKSGITLIIKRLNFKTLYLNNVYITNTCAFKIGINCQIKQLNNIHIIFFLKTFFSDSLHYVDKKSKKIRTLTNDVDKFTLCVISQLFGWLSFWREQGCPCVRVGGWNVQSGNLFQIDSFTSNVSYEQNKLKRQKFPQHTGVVLFCKTMYLSATARVLPLHEHGRSD